MRAAIVAESPGAQGPVRRIIRAFDRFLCRLQGVFVFWDDPGCMFRPQIAHAPHPIVLPEGTIPAGAKVLALHVWNEQMPQIPAEGPTLALGLRASRMVVASFRILAREMGRDPRLAAVQALGGSTVLFAVDDASGAEKLFLRLGFTLFPYRHPLGRFGEFWENLYTWALMWAYNAVSLRQRRLIALRRTEVWMAPGVFLRKYGGEGREPRRANDERDSP